MLYKKLKLYTACTLMSMALSVHGMNTPQQPVVNPLYKHLKWGISGAALTLIAMPIIMKALNRPPQEITTDVGVVKINGAIESSAQWYGQLQMLFKDPKIKAIVLSIESGGGRSGTSQALFLEILSLKKQFPKPIISLIENVAASGAYYIAAATDYIIASPSAFIGSIGCYMKVTDIKALLDKYDVAVEYIKCGEHKTGGNHDTHLTQAQRDHFQSAMNRVYEQFTSDIISQRKDKLSSLDPKVWAEGKVFAAEDALKIGLIDSLGSISTLTEVVKEKAKITTEINWVSIQPRIPFLKSLISSLGFVASNLGGQAAQGFSKQIKQELHESSVETIL